MSLEYPNPELRNINSTDPTGKINARLEDLTPIIDEINTLLSAPASTPPGGGTAVGILGAGTINTLSKFATNTTTIADSQIFDNGTAVGINTATPTAKLAVNMTDTNNVNENVAGVFKSTGIGSAQFNIGLLVNTSGSTRDTFGNYGILVETPSLNGFNTSSPDAIVEIKGSTSINDKYALRVANNGGTKLFQVRNDGNIGINYINGAVSGTKLYIDGGLTASNAYALRIDGDGTGILNILNNGSVGIGTAAPTATLEIASTTSGLVVSRMTATQGSAVTKIDGMIIYVTDTNGTFTSLGFWGVENNVWVKL